MGGVGAKFPVGGGLDVRGIVHGLRVRAHPEQGRRSAGLVVNLDQELPPAALDEFRFGGAGGDFHAHLRTDFDGEEAIRIEDFLHRPDRGARIARLHDGDETLLIGGTERSAEVVGRLEQAPYLREQGLGFDFGDERQIRREGGKGGRPSEGDNRKTTQSSDDAHNGGGGYPDAGDRIERERRSDYKICDQPGPPCTR